MLKASPDNAHLRVRLPALLLLALAAVLGAAPWLAELHVLDGSQGFPLDDSWIHLAFAQNLAAGHGLSINPGQPVAGTTGPLWTALVSLATLLPVDALVVVKLLGLAFHLGGVLLTLVLARRLGLGRGLSSLAAVLTLGTGWLAWSAVSGMEISLFVFLSLAGMVLHLEERDDPARPPLSFALFGLAVLARPEGLGLLAAAIVDRALRWRRLAGGELALDRAGGPAGRRLAAGLGLAGLAVVPVAAFYLWIGGSPLPTTLAAKTGGGVHLPSVRYLQLAAGVLFRSQPWMTVLAPVGAVELVRRLGTARGPDRGLDRDRGLLPVLWLAGLPLAYSCITPAANPLLGNFGRYLFPLLPVVVVLGCLGLQPLVRLVAPGGGSAIRRWLALAAVVVLVAPTIASYVQAVALYARNVSDVESGDVAMARWLRERLPAEAVIATMDIGALGALLPNPIVDLAAIADPRVRGYMARAEAAGGTWQDGVLAFVRDRRPDYLVVFPDWLTDVARSGSPFRPLESVHVPGNVTLGRDTLVLYATPWTRYPLRRVADDAGGVSPPEPHEGADR